MQPQSTTASAPSVETPGTARHLGSPMVAPAGAPPGTARNLGTPMAPSGAPAPQPYYYDLYVNQYGYAPGYPPNFVPPSASQQQPPVLPGAGGYTYGVASQPDVTAGLPYTYNATQQYPGYVPPPIAMQQQGGAAPTLGPLAQNGAAAKPDAFHKEGNQFPGAPPAAAPDIFGSESAMPDAEMGGAQADDKVYLSAALDRIIRHGFIRKVYSILTVLLIITFGITTSIAYIPVINEYFSNHRFIGMATALGACVLAIVLSCSTKLCRAHPWNMILLLIMAILEGVTIGCIALFVPPRIFVMATGLTALVTLSLSVFACQTRWDFTGCTVYLLVAGVVMLVFGIVAAIIRSHILHLVYACVATLLFSVYIVYDTQLIIGGEREEQFSVDDYVVAVLHLYLDIINLFVYILYLFTACENS